LFLAWMIYDISRRECERHERREAFNQSIERTKYYRQTMTTYRDRKRRNGSQCTMNSQNKADMVARYNMATTRVIGRRQATASTAITIPDISTALNKSHISRASSSALVVAYISHPQTIVERERENTMGYTAATKQKFHRKNLAYVTL